MSWAVPKFAYGDHVRLKPVEADGRVIELKWVGTDGTVEYMVRYFFEGKEQMARVFEDELTSIPPP